MNGTGRSRRDSKIYRRLNRVFQSTYATTQRELKKRERISFVSEWKSPDATRQRKAPRQRAWADGRDLEREHASAKADARDKTAAAAWVFSRIYYIQGASTASIRLGDQ